MAQGEATPAVFVSQLGNPSLLSLITQQQCPPSPEVSSSGVLCRVTWPTEALSVREPRSQQLVGMPGTLRALADVSPSRYPSESGETLGGLQVGVSHIYVSERPHWGGM